MNPSRQSLLFTFFAFVQSLTAGDNPASFRYYKDVESTVATSDEIVSFYLDAEIYASTRHRYPDLRVLHDNNTEIPYLLEKVTQSRVQQADTVCASEVLSLQEKPDNRIEILLKLNDDSPSAEGLTVITPFKNYEHRTSIYGSGDGIEWSPLVVGTLIFDYARFIDLENNRIVLPENSYRYFRVGIDQVTENFESPLKRIVGVYQEQTERERFEGISLRRRPFRIDRIELWHRTEKSRFQGNTVSEYPVLSFDVSEKNSEKVTVIDIETQLEPLTAFTLLTPDRNFSRKVVVQVKRKESGLERWVEIGRTTISAIRLQDLLRENLQVTFSEHRERRFRLLIFNLDNPPLKISGLLTTGNTYRVTFLAQPNTPYNVVFSSENAARPVYDTPQVLASLDRIRGRTHASLGPRQPNPKFDRSADQYSKSIFDSRPFLFGAIGLMVVVLGWILFRSSRKLEGLTDS